MEPHAPTNRRTSIIVLGIAVALIALLVVAVLVWPSDDAGGDGAKADAEEACSIAERLPDSLRPEDSSEYAIAVHRLGAVGSLTMAAEEADDDFADLAEAAHAARVEHGETFEITADTLDALRDECDALD